MAKGKGRRGGVKLGIKGPGPVHVLSKKPTGKPPKRIRMLISLASQHGSWIIGRSYRVPHEVSNDSARRWIRSGAAEEDTSLDDPPETK